MATYFAGGKVLVTGASGFIGGAVVRRLLRSGVAVRGMSRKKRGSDPMATGTMEEMEWVQGDLTVEAECARAVAGVDWIFHVAGDYRFGRCWSAEIWRNNVEGTRCLLAAAERAGVRRIVCTGSPAIFAASNNGTRAVNESRVSDAAADWGPYKRSKLAAYRLIREWGGAVEWVNVFPTAVIGSGDRRPTPTGRILVEFTKGRLPLLTRTGLSFVSVEAVAEGHLRAMIHGGAGEDYLLAGENLMLQTFLERVGAVIGRDAPRWHCPYLLQWVTAWGSEWATAWSGREPFAAVEAVRMARQVHFFNDHKARSALGYRAGCLDTAIGEALQDYAERGWIPHARLAKRVGGAMGTFGGGLETQNEVSVQGGR